MPHMNIYCHRRWYLFFLIGVLTIVSCTSKPVDEPAKTEGQIAMSKILSILPFTFREGDYIIASQKDRTYDVFRVLGYVHVKRADLIGDELVVIDSVTVAPGKRDTTPTGPYELVTRFKLDFAIELEAISVNEQTSESAKRSIELDSTNIPNLVVHRLDPTQVTKLSSASVVRVKIRK
jgi:hypothetical protein